MIQTVQSVGVVVFQDDQVLIVENGIASSHKKGMIGLPAGKVDPGETHGQAAVRELCEETGLKTEEEYLKPIKIFEATIEQKTGMYHFIWHTFLCTKWSGELVGTDETAPQWITLDALKKMENVLPNVVSAILLAKGV